MFSKPIATDPELLRLLELSKQWWENASEEEKEAMLKEQRESWVRAEMSWPKPKYHYENGVKVYESYEDYCNG